MTEVQKAHQTLLEQVRQTKRIDYLVQAGRKEVAKGEIHVHFGMFPEGATFKSPGGCKFRDKCAYKHTAKPGDEKENPASIAIHIPSNDERRMELWKTQSDDKTQYRVRLRHLADKNVLERDKLGPTLGVIQIGFQNQRNPNGPISEEQSIEWSLSMEEKARRSAWIFAQKTCTKFQVCILRIDIGSFKPSPASNVSSRSQAS